MKIKKNIKESTDSDILDQFNNFFDCLDKKHIVVKDNKICYEGTTYCNINNQIENKFDMVPIKFGSLKKAGFSIYNNDLSNTKNFPADCYKITLGNLGIKSPIDLEHCVTEGMILDNVKEIVDFKNQNLPSSLRSLTLFNMPDLESTSGIEKYYPLRTLALHRNNKLKETVIDFKKSDIGYIFVFVEPNNKKMSMIYPILYDQKGDGDHSIPILTFIPGQTGTLIDIAKKYQGKGIKSLLPLIRDLRLAGYTEQARY